MHFIKTAIILLLIGKSLTGNAQEISIKVSPEVKFQTIDGFGAALAYYENWLSSHPNKSEIYDAIFGELSLDLLRVRNAYGYDNGMVGRVKEFVTAAEKVRGNPIPWLSTSWGPPASLKSNNNRNNGGTLKYTIVDGKVEFDYAGFADWWNASIDDYEKNGISPTYVSIQNEPDFKASYESCLLNPFEKANTTDTLAGYNKALQAVYDKLSTRNNAPKLIGPECIGIGYNAVKNYVLHLDTTLLYAVAHHLYHGVNVDSPWANTEMAALRTRYPNLKLFQSEYSGNDWFNLSGLMFKSFVDEEVSAYFYWDLIWTNGGLVSVDNPWNRASWKNANGYEKRKEFYAFKQFSAYVQPGWKRVGLAESNTSIETVAFMSPGEDSLSVVIINRSTAAEKELKFDLGNFNFAQSELFSTSESLNCASQGKIENSTCIITPKSINTAFFTTSFRDGVDEMATGQIKAPKVFPNPFTTTIHLDGIPLDQNWTLFTMDGCLLRQGKGSLIEVSDLMKGSYILKVNRYSFKVMKQ